MTRVIESSDSLMKCNDSIHRAIDSLMKCNDSIHRAIDSLMKCNDSSHDLMNPINEAPSNKKLLFKIVRPGGVFVEKWSKKGFLSNFNILPI